MKVSYGKINIKLKTINVVNNSIKYIKDII